MTVSLIWVGRLLRLRGLWSPPTPPNGERISYSVEKRLRSLYFYYFSDFKNWDGRLTVIEGDLTDETRLAQAGDIDTVINCAANVTHFALCQRRQRV